MSSQNDRAPYEEYPAWWTNNGTEAIDLFTDGKRSFIAGLLPEKAVEMSIVETLGILYRRLGDQALQKAMNPDERYPSPLEGSESTDWIKQSRTVGINVRTIGNFVNVVKYALTIPAHIDTIHLLPVWESGVAASLYGMASRRINPEFFSEEVAIRFPQLNTVEAQLKVSVNLLHALGKKVGLDVIPHTDRYSEMVLANPDFFEWLHRSNLSITNQGDELVEQVEMAILGWLRMNGSCRVELSELWTLLSPDRFFRELSETDRLEHLFGLPSQYAERQERRISLIDHLYHLGLEPVPATMAPPYRGLEVDPDPAASTTDDAGRVWRDYKITHPKEMSRVFGPLTRFKLYERKDNNKNWVIDFSRPRPAVWQYVQRFYAEQQAAFGFDFMRGDMSHVQMRPSGVPAHPDPEFYDLLAAVKKHIRQLVPHFAYFAESFLTADNYMAYGNEVDHLEASQAEVTLGNLQSMATHDPEFHANLKRYLDIAGSRNVSPVFTIITGDKDDPRFDGFYLRGNLARMFFALFMPKLPAYCALGYEQRDIHPVPVANEYYTKLYVFQLKSGPKATNGPYRWGKNTDQFFGLDQLHRQAESLLAKVKPDSFAWVLPVDATGNRQYCAWGLDSETHHYLFIVNFGTEQHHAVRILLPSAITAWELEFTTGHPETEAPELFGGAPANRILSRLDPGVGLIFRSALQPS